MACFPIPSGQSKMVVDVVWMIRDTESMHCLAQRHSLQPAAKQTDAEEQNDAGSGSTKWHMLNIYYTYIQLYTHTVIIQLYNIYYIIYMYVCIYIYIYVYIYVLQLVLWNIYIYNPGTYLYITYISVCIYV